MGFTLAEVLITLVIIGVIAAMTVPTLMQNTNAQEYRTAFKKSISALSQALSLSYALDGITASDCSSVTELVDDIFKKRLSVIDSTTSASAGTWKGTGDASCSGTVLTTNDGIKYCFASHSGSTSTTGACNVYNTEPCSSGAGVYIDVNGDRKPNKLTTNANAPKDIYTAIIYSQKVVPYGEAAQGVMYDVQSDSTEESGGGGSSSGGEGGGEG